MMSRFGLGLGGVTRGGVSAYIYVNAEAAALVARFTTPPSSARSALIDTLVGALKTSGAWAKRDFYHIYAAHDAQAARRNWKQDTYNATAVSGPTFTADRGYACNGSSSYLRTNFNPGDGGAYNYLQNDASFGVYSRTSLSAGTGMMGALNTHRAQLYGRNASSNASAWINQTSTATAWTGGVVTTSLGFIDLQRVDASNTELYLNSTSLGTQAVASTGVPNAEFYTGAMNNAGSPISYGAYEFAMDKGGGELTPTELANENAAILTYLQAVGAA